MVRIHIIGAGVVGAATGKGFLQHGYDVRFLDTDPGRVQELAAQGLSADLPDRIALSDGDAVFISVTALTSARGIDLSHVYAATETVGKAIASCSGSVTVVYRCTMPPGTMRHDLIPVLERHAGKVLGLGMEVAYCPEYLRAQTAETDFLNPRLVTIASRRRGDAAHRNLVWLMADFGSSLRWMPLEAAEFQKYVNNVGNAIKVSTYNWFRLYGQRCGLSSQEVDEAFDLSLLSAENLWNPVYGTRDFGAYGGACLPKDTRAMICHARDLGLDTALLDATEEINALVARDAARWDLQEVVTHRDGARRDVPPWNGSGVRNA